MQEIFIGNNIQVYVQEDEEVGLLCLPYPQKKTLSNLSTTNDTTIVCKCNASYFNGSVVQGKNQGYNEDFTPHNDSPNQEPNKERYDVVVDKNNDLHYGKFESWDYQFDNKLGYSTPAVLMAEGKDVELLSSYLGISSGHISTPNYFTYFGRLANGKYFIAGSKHISAREFRKRLKQRLQVNFLSMNDGGGSTQINYNGKVVFDDGEIRPIPNCIVFYKWNNPKPVKPLAATEYAIYPMEEVYITQGQGGTGSHRPDTKAWDIATRIRTSDDRYKRAYAPTTCKVLGFDKVSRANAVLFGTCDEQGNPKKVRCKDGIDRVLTYALLHDDYIENLKVGQIFKTGEYLYNQGMAGGATGPHIHMEVAEGWQYERENREGAPSRQIKNAIDLSKVFYLLDNWNYIFDANGETFKTVKSRNIEEKKPDNCEEIKKENESLKVANKDLTEKNNELIKINQNLQENNQKLVNEVKNLTNKIEKIKQIVV